MLRVTILRPPLGWCALLTLAVAAWGVSPAEAVPSFSGQTGLPCAACHVGAFGPQLTPFGISFRQNGYTLGGGSGPWSKIPVSIEVTPSYQHTAKALPTAPAGYGTNDFFNTLGVMTNLFITGGHSFDSAVGIGGFFQVAIMNPVPGQGLNFSLATSDLEITKPLTLGDHPLMLGFDFTNQPTGGDPYLSLYNGFQFPYIFPFVGPFPTATPAISGLGLTAYGLSLYALYDSTLFVEGGLYQTWSTSLLSTMNLMPSSLGTIAGSAPYFRIADQHAWDDNFLEIGGVFMDIPLQQIPGASTPSSQNRYDDWGFDATYQRTFGPDTLAITSNILFETQSLGASFASGLSSNPTDWLDQFRIAASYYWQDTYGLTLAYTSTYGSTDPLLYTPGPPPPAPLTGSANGSPNSQAIIAQIDWTPYGKTTTDPSYPWLNLRIGLQYTHYLQFNGGTTNYDGSGRNAGDNDQLLLFIWMFF